MRVAFVVQRYGLEVNGGAEYHCRSIAERLVSYCSVDVITTCAIDYISWRNEYFNGEEQINGVRVIRFLVDSERDIEAFNLKSAKIFESSSKSEEIEWMKMQGPYSSSLIRYISTHQSEYNCIFFITYLYCTTFFGLQEVKDKAILIPTSHDEPPIYLSIFKEVFSSPQYILYNTYEECCFVHKLFKNTNIPSNIVGVGVDGSNIIISPKVFIQRYGFGNFILYAGRIDPSKGCQELFDFFIRYKNIYPSDLKLVLIGKAVMPIPDYPDIIFLGFVDKSDKFNAMASAKLLVMPSKYESLSMVLLESWFCKRPVLVNGACNVLSGQCKRSNGGLWYNNYEEFEACLTWLLENEKYCIQLGESGFQFVQENYNWEAIEKKYLDAINFVMNKEKT